MIAILFKPQFVEDETLMGSVPQGNGSWCFKSLQPVDIIMSVKAR